MGPREAATARLAHPGLDGEGLDQDDIHIPFVRENRLAGLLEAGGIDLDHEPTLDRQSHLFAELEELLFAFDSDPVGVVLIKYPDLPKHHRDLDLLVVDGIEAVHDRLSQRGYDIVGDGEPYKRGYAREAKWGTVDLDVHEAVSWWGNVYLEADRIWDDRSRRQLHGVTVPVPSPEHELLILAANAAFGEVRLNLFDVFTAWWLTEQGVEVSTARLEAQTLGWGDQFDYICALIETVHRDLFDQPLDLGDTDLAPSEVPALPYRYPFRRLLGLRAAKLRAEFGRGGLRTAAASARGYTLELLQLSVDYLFYRTGLPKHSIFNFRSLLSRANR